MKLKTFTANSMPEAMNQLRELLGPDAVILSSSTEKSTGLVSITAAIEDEVPASGGKASVGDDLRHADRIRAALRFHRAPDDLIERLISRTAGLGEVSANKALAGALGAELAFAPPDLKRGARPLLLAGPPGAGKSATVAKLAARARLAGLDVALITADTGKAGGQEQMTAFAKALETPLHLAHELPALPEVIASVRADLLLIDTPGLDPFDSMAVALLADSANAAEADCILTLPAGLDASESAETALVFKEAGAAGMFVTKIDVTRRLGGLLSAAKISGLSLLGAGVAPTIADGLAPLGPIALARLLLPESDSMASPNLATGTKS